MGNFFTYILKNMKEIKKFLTKTYTHNQGRAYSMNRLDQLATPVRRNGEHIRAILERERNEQMELFDDSASLGGGRRSAGARKLRRIGGSVSPGGSSSVMSCSMTHLTGAGTSATGTGAGNAGLGGGSGNSTMRGKYSLGGGISSNFLPLGHTSYYVASKSMTHLSSPNNQSHSHNWSTPILVCRGGTTTKNYKTNAYATLYNTQKSLKLVPTPLSTLPPPAPTKQRKPTKTSTSSSLYNLNYATNLSTYNIYNNNTTTCSTIFNKTTTTTTTTTSTTTTQLYTSKRGQQQQEQRNKYQQLQYKQQQKYHQSNNNNKNYYHHHHNQQQQNYHNSYQFDRFDPNSLLLMNSSSLLLTAGVCASLYSLYRSQKSN